MKALLENSLARTLEEKAKFLTVNFHITNRCNYKCKFCYAHFRESLSLNVEHIKSILIELKNFGFRRINLAGGEPFLYKGIEEILATAKFLGLKTSIISNGSFITKEWIFQYGKFLDILGISCDSADPITLQNLGRGRGTIAEKVKKIFDCVDEFNLTSNHQIYKKLNTVITKLNFQEDMTDFVKSLNIQRWKILQVLPIENENWREIDPLLVTNEEFEFFVERHLNLQNEGIEVIPEDNNTMTESYLMIGPEGRFYQNTNGAYSFSSPILEVGVQKALHEIQFDIEKFIKRKGFY